MPITNYSKLARFSDACGAEIPRWVANGSWKPTVTTYIGSIKPLANR